MRRRWISRRRELLCRKSDVIGINSYSKTTYQGNLNCFFLCLVSLHTPSHTLRNLLRSCSKLQVSVLFILLPSLPSASSMDGSSAPQAHAFVSLSEAHPTPTTTKTVLATLSFSAWPWKWWNRSTCQIAWDPKPNCRVPCQCNKTTKIALRTAHTCSVSYNEALQCHTKTLTHDNFEMRTRTPRREIAMLSWEVQQREQQRVWVWRSYGTNWDENFGGGDILKRGRQCLRLSYLYLRLWGWRHQVWALSFLKQNVLRERMNTGTYMSGPGWSNGGTCNFFCKMTLRGVF